MATVTFLTSRVIATIQIILLATKLSSSAILNAQHLEPGHQYQSLTSSNSANLIGDDADSGISDGNDNSTTEDEFYLEISEEEPESLSRFDDSMGRFFYCGSIQKNNCKTSCRSLGYPIVQCGKISCYCTY